MVIYVKRMQENKRNYNIKLGILITRKKLNKLSNVRGLWS